jgi:hypothetical protein
MVVVRPTTAFWWSSKITRPVRAAEIRTSAPTTPEAIVQMASSATRTVRGRPDYRVSRAPPLPESGSSSGSPSVICAPTQSAAEPAGATLSADTPVTVAYLPE